MDLRKEKKSCSLVKGEKIKAGFVVLGPGEKMKQHITKDREEFILVWEGRAKIGICGDNGIWGYETTGAVDFFYIGPNVWHDVENTGKGILRYVYVVAKH